MLLRGKSCHPKIKKPSSFSYLGEKPENDKFYILGENSKTIDFEILQIPDVSCERSDKWSGEWQ